MDIYNIIRESKKDEEILTHEQIERLYSPFIEEILFQIINMDEKEDYSKICEKILKKRDDFQTAKLNDDFEDFEKDLINDFTKVFKLDKKKKIEEFLDYVEKLSNKNSRIMFKVANDSDIIIFKLFYDEYNNKASFTWGQFKKVKKIYEKNHPLKGENLYNLKSLLEKDPRLEKIDNNTLFSKHAHTLTDKTVDKIKEKISI